MLSDQRAPHWTILGAGAIGTLFAHRLADSGCDVTLISRAHEVPQKVLTLERNTGPQRRSFDLSPSAARGPLTQLLVTTKAADVDPGIASVRHRLQADSTVLVLANGMGFTADLPHGLPLFRGSTTEGAFRRSADQTVHAGRGSTRIGLPGAELPAPAWFERSWARLDACHWDPDIDSTLWRKLAINCVVNPLTAVYRCRNGELAAAHYRARLEMLCSEVTAACRAAGHADAVSGLLDEVLRVVNATSANQSSMLQDVLAGRRTEIDFLNGFLLSVPTVSTLPLPLTRRLVDAVEQGIHLREPR